MLTKRRTWPFSNRRPATPLCFAHKLSSASLTVPPATSTVAAPPVCCRMGVGMWTLIGIEFFLTRPRVGASTLRDELSFLAQPVRAHVLLTQQIPADAPDPTRKSAQIPRAPAESPRAVRADP